MGRTVIAERRAHLLNPVDHANVAGGELTLEEMVQTIDAQLPTAENGDAQAFARGR
jgi:hypothetical protein